VRKLACAFGCVSIASEKAKAAASCRTPRRPSGAASQKVCGIRRPAGNVWGINAAFASKLKSMIYLFSFPFIHAGK
jgi:hypothetical protein